MPVDVQTSSKQSLESDRQIANASSRGVKDGVRDRSGRADDAEHANAFDAAVEMRIVLIHEPHVEAWQVRMNGIR